MKKKDAIKWLEDIVDVLERTEMEMGDGMQTTEDEAKLLACGLICGLDDAIVLLKYGPCEDTPRKQANEMLATTITAYEAVTKR